ncbi:MAG: metallopeptidase TldD-related protein, partial [Pseudomonadota bacterium]
KNFTANNASSIVDDALKNLDDGELYLENSVSEVFGYTDNTLKNVIFDSYSGFGLRGILGDMTAYAHSSLIDNDSMKNAASIIKSLDKFTNNANQNLNNINLSGKKNLYTSHNPINVKNFGTKIKLLKDINSYIRSKDPRITQVSVSLAGNWQIINIIKYNNNKVSDIRPLVKLVISVIISDNGRVERGSYSTGGRVTYEQFFDEEKWQSCADLAIKQAMVNLRSVPAPAGIMPVVLSNGEPGVLLHEAIGHGLEGDFNRKKTSAFTNLIGTKVAADDITVIDDGTIPNLRGSIAIDDEGTKSARNVLVENGILKSYMMDRMNAKLMGTESTGNGRRQNYTCQPMPRMTNTFMESGKYSSDEIISSVDNGIYAVDFDGGQVDITSGKFVFSISEAYKIKNGKITEPIKGATLIGDGKTALKNITMMGNDSSLDPGSGTCGKDGQSVPVGVGQPTLLINEMTVGGTDF